MNSVSSTLDLSLGQASRALLAKAGPGLQTACSKLAPIEDGEVKQTDGFQLHCKTVLHCRCAAWHNQIAVQVFFIGDQRKSLLVSIKLKLILVSCY